MSLEANADIFGRGREALALAHDAFEGRVFFASARRLQPDGSWLGPGEAVLAVVEEDALAGLGGLRAARSKGANALLCNLGSPLHRQAVELGMRSLVRVPFLAGESVQERRTRMGQLAVAFRDRAGLDGIAPVPVGEAQGLDTIQFFAACRLVCPAAHLVVDVELLGHKLGQLCLSFGADEIMGSIVNQRPLRLGALAASKELTRDESAQLLRASGFVPCERLAEGKVQAL
jgi:hypothetical protein